MSLKALGAILSAAPVLALLSACPAAGPRELRLGVISYILPEDDPASAVEGYSTDKAAELAAAEINASGGMDIGGRRVPFALVRRAIDPVAEEAVAAVQDLVNREKVSAIIGPSMSSQAISAGGAAESARVPLISSVSSNPATTAGRSYVFRMCFTDRVQAAALMRFARGSGGELAIVYEASDSFSSGLASFLREEAGATAPPALGLTLDMGDFRERLESLAPFRQKYILLPASSEFSIKAASALRSLGYGGPFLGADGWDRERQKALREFQGSFMTTNYASGIESPSNKAFVAAYRALSGRDPGDTAALTYDSINMVAKAASKARGVDPTALRDALSTLEGFTGVSGSVRFSGGGDPERSVVLLSFRDGQVLVAGEIDPE